MLFHLLNCLNCGELCLFLFFFFWKWEGTVRLLYEWHYLIFILAVSVSLSSTTNIWQMYHRTSLCSACLAPHVVQHKMIYVPSRKRGLKNKKQTKKKENGCLKYTMKAGARCLRGMRFILWGNPQSVASLRPGFEDCLACSTLPAFFTFKESQRDKSFQMFAANRVKLNQQQNNISTW